MNDLKNGCVVDVEKTFGEIDFVGVAKEMTAYVNNQRRRVGWVINVCSEKIPGNIQIQVKNTAPIALQPMDSIRFDRLISECVVRRDQSRGFVHVDSVFTCSRVFSK